VRRREKRTNTIFFGAVLCAWLFALCCIVNAQQPKIPRIGFLTGDPDHVGLFRQALRDVGYIERKNVFLEYRDIGEQRERIESLVNELIALKVDVLVARAQPAIRAAKLASKSTPVVMMTTQDPVAAGFINNLARPGGNVTGITTLQRELSGKRLELLKETLPDASRVAALVNATSTGDYKTYEAPARRLNIQLQSIRVQASNPDLDGAFEAAVKRRANALIPINAVPTFELGDRLSL
jgi:putative ABC transport system substrate-binding protein